MAYTILGQQRAHCDSTLGAIAVGGKVGRHITLNACGLQIGGRHNHMHTRHVTGVSRINRSNLTMGNGRTQKISMQSTRGRYVVDIATMPGQQPNILNPRNRLAFAEFFHALHPQNYASRYPNPPKRFVHIRPRVEKNKNVRVKPKAQP